MTTEQALFTVKSSKKSVTEIFRVTKNLIFALDPSVPLMPKLYYCMTVDVIGGWSQKNNVN